jgi:hypothetical protein
MPDLPKEILIAFAPFINGDVDVCVMCSAHVTLYFLFTGRRACPVAAEVKFQT